MADICDEAVVVIITDGAEAADVRGTPTLYYGDEIDMPQVDISPSRIRDPFELNVPGKGLGRDGARTPMQWSTTRSDRTRS